MTSDHWPLTTKDPLVPASPFGSLIKAEVTADRCVPTGALDFSGDPATGVWTGQLYVPACTLDWPSEMNASFKNWSASGSPAGNYCWTFIIDGPPCPRGRYLMSACFWPASRRSPLPPATAIAAATEAAEEAAAATRAPRSRRSCATPQPPA